MSLYATMLKLDVSGAKATVRGRFMGRGSVAAETVMTGCQGVFVDLDIESKASRDEIAKLARLSEAGCFVIQSLREPVPVSMSVVLNGEALEYDVRAPGSDGSRIFERREDAVSTFEIENDTSLFAPLVSHLQNELERFGLVRGEERVLAGVAIEEALLNGMIHGNLELEGQIRDEGFARFHARVEKRRRESPYKHRRLRIETRMTHAEATISIRDEGAGFDTSMVPDPLAPENQWRSSGRGLLLIRKFLDEVSFNEKGNEIRLVKRRTASER